MYIFLLFFLISILFVFNCEILFYVCKYCFLHCSIICFIYLFINTFYIYIIHFLDKITTNFGFLIFFY
jgi:hypothetical protein